MSKKYVAIILVAGLIGLFLFPSSPYAGWVQKDRDGSKTLISEGKIKTFEDEDSQSWLVLDYAKDRVTLVDGTRKVFATGPIDAYCSAMKSMFQSFETPETGSGEAGDATAGDVKIVSKGEETVAGLRAERYAVMVEGELYEEVWITRASELMKDLGDFGLHEKLMDCAAESDDLVERSDAYRKMARKGYALRSISYEFGEKEYAVDVVELRETPVPAAEFDPPGAFRKLTFTEFFKPGM